MKLAKKILLFFVVGLIGTISIASGAELKESISGVFRKDFSIRIDGKQTEFHPVIINGDSYLPVREIAKIMGYDVNWNENNKEIHLDKKKSGWITEGVVSALSNQDGIRRIELIGKPLKGDFSIIIVSLNENTIITNVDGEEISAEDIAIGTHITADFGPIVFSSLPSKGHANKIIVGDTFSVTEGEIEAIVPTQDGLIITLSNEKSNLKLIVDNNTVITTEMGEEVNIAELSQGDEVRAFYSLSSKAGDSAIRIETLINLSKS